VGHPGVPFGGDGGCVVVVYVAWFDPAVLAEGVVDTVFVVAVSCGVGSHEGSEFEGIVSVSIHVLEEGKHPSSILDGLLNVSNYAVYHRFLLIIILWLL